MQPTRVLPAVSVLSLISVEYGGWALLGYLTGRGQLGQFQEKFFRAGHAHAGVLLVLSLVYYLYLDRTGYSDRVKWIAGGLLQAGILAPPGGVFFHVGGGQPAGGGRLRVAVGPGSGGAPRAVGGVLYPRRAGAAQQGFPRNGGDAPWGPAHRGGAGHPGRGPTQERAPRLAPRTEREQATHPRTALST